MKLTPVHIKNTNSLKRYYLFLLFLKDNIIIHLKNKILIVDEAAHENEPNVPSCHGRAWRLKHRARNWTK